MTACIRNSIVTKCSGEFQFSHPVSPLTLSENVISPEPKTSQNRNVSEKGGPLSENWAPYGSINVMAVQRSIARPPPESVLFRTFSVKFYPGNPFSIKAPIRALPA